MLSTRTATSLGALLALGIFVWFALRDGGAGSMDTVAPPAAQLSAARPPPEEFPAAPKPDTRVEQPALGAAPELPGPIPVPSDVASAVGASANTLKVLDETTGRDVTGAWARVYWSRDPSRASAWNEVVLTAVGSTFSLPELDVSRVKVCGVLVGGDQHAPRWVQPLDGRSWGSLPPDVALERGGGVAVTVVAEQPLPAFLSVEQTGAAEQRDRSRKWPVLASGQLVAAVSGPDPVTLTIAAVELGAEGQLDVPIPPLGVTPFGSVFLETDAKVEVRVLRSSGEPLAFREVTLSRAASGPSSGRQFRTDERGIFSCFENDLRERHAFTSVQSQRVDATSVLLDPDGASIVFPLSLMSLEADDVAEDPIDEVFVQPLTPALQLEAIGARSGVSSSNPTMLVREGFGLYVVGHTAAGRRLAAVVRPGDVRGDFAVRLEESPATMGAIRVDCANLVLGTEETMGFVLFHNHFSVANARLGAGQSHWHCGGLLPGDYTVHAMEGSSGYSYADPRSANAIVAAGATTSVAFAWQRGGRVRLSVRDESTNESPPTLWSARLRDSSGEWRDLLFVRQTAHSRTTGPTLSSGQLTDVHGILPPGPALLEVRDVVSGTRRTEQALEIQPGETLTVELALQ